MSGEKIGDFNEDFSRIVTGLSDKGGPIWAKTTGYQQECQLTLKNRGKPPVVIAKLDTPSGDPNFNGTTSLFAYQASTINGDLVNRFIIFDPDNLEGKCIVLIPIEKGTVDGLVAGGLSSVTFYSSAEGFTTAGEFVTSATENNQWHYFGQTTDTGLANNFEIMVRLGRGSDKWSQETEAFSFANRENSNAKLAFSEGENIAIYFASKDIRSVEIFEAVSSDGLPTYGITIFYFVPYTSKSSFWTVVPYALAENEMPTIRADGITSGLVKNYMLTGLSILSYPKVASSKVVEGATDLSAALSDTQELFAIRVDDAVAKSKLIESAVTLLDNIEAEQRKPVPAGQSTIFNGELWQNATATEFTPPVAPAAYGETELKAAGFVKKASGNVTPELYWSNVDLEGVTVATDQTAKIGYFQEAGKALRTYRIEASKWTENKAASDATQALPVGAASEIINANENDLSPKSWSAADLNFAVKTMLKNYGVIAPYDPDRWYNKEEAVIYGGSIYVSVFNTDFRGKTPPDAAYWTGPFSLSLASYASKASLTAEIEDRNDGDAALNLRLDVLASRKEVKDNIVTTTTITGASLPATQDTPAPTASPFNNDGSGPVAGATSWFCNGPIGIDISQAGLADDVFEVSVAFGSAVASAEFRFRVGNVFQKFSTVGIEDGPLNITEWSDGNWRGATLRVTGPFTGQVITFQKITFIGPVVRRTRKDSFEVDGKGLALRSDLADLASDADVTAVSNSVTALNTKLASLLNLEAKSGVEVADGDPTWFGGAWWFNKSGALVKLPDTITEASLTAAKFERATALIASGTAADIIAGTATAAVTWSASSIKQAISALMVKPGSRIWDAGETYAKSELVVQSGVTYRSAGDGNKGYNPSSSPTQWEDASKTAYSDLKANRSPTASDVQPLGKIWADTSYGEKDPLIYLSKGNGAWEAQNNITLKAIRISVKGYITSYTAFSGCDILDRDGNTYPRNTFVVGARSANIYAGASPGATYTGQSFSPYVNETAWFELEPAAGVTLKGFSGAAASFRGDKASTGAASVEVFYTNGGSRRYDVGRQFLGRQTFLSGVSADFPVGSSVEASQQHRLSIAEASDVSGSVFGLASGEVLSRAISSRITTPTSQHDLGAAIAQPLSNVRSTQAHLEGGAGYSIAAADYADNFDATIIDTSGSDGTFTFSGFDGVFVLDGKIRTALTSPVTVKANTGYRIEIVHNGSTKWMNLVPLGATGSADASTFLKTDDAISLYQPKGDYQPAGNYATPADVLAAIDAIPQVVPRVGTGTEIVTGTLTTIRSWGPKGIADGINSIVGAEKTARETADTALSTRITTLETPPPNTAVRFNSDLQLFCNNQWTVRSIGALSSFDAPDGSNHYRAKRDMVLDVSVTAMSSDGNSITIGFAVQLFRASTWLNTYDNITLTNPSAGVYPFHRSVQIALKAGDYLRFLTNVNDGGNNNYPGDRTFRIAISEAPTLTIMPANSTVLSPRAITGSGSGAGYDGVPVPVRINVAAGQGLLTVAATGGATVSGIDPLSNTCLVTVNGADTVLSHTASARSTFSGLQRVSSVSTVLALTTAATDYDVGTTLLDGDLIEVAHTFSNSVAESQMFWIRVAAGSTQRSFPWPDAVNYQTIFDFAATLTSKFKVRQSSGNASPRIIGVKVWRDAANGFVIPNGTQIVTTRAITGSVTANGYDNLELPYLIPLAPGTALDTVSPASARILSAAAGLIAVKPNGADVAVTHTTKVVGANLTNFTNAGGNTSDPYLSILVPYRSGALLDQIEFTFKDRRNNGRSVAIVMPMAYFQKTTNNGWTYWRDTGRNDDVMVQDLTFSDGAIYRLHVYARMMTQGIQFLFSEAHPIGVSANLYGAVTDFIGKFRI